MSFLLPAQRGSTSRAFSTTAAVGRAVGMAKSKMPNARAIQKKLGQQSANKARYQAPSSRIKAGGVALRTNLAQEPPALNDLVQLYPESMIPVNVGKGSVLPRNTYDQLKVFGLPRKLGEELSWSVPTSVIRSETVDMVKTLAGAKTKSSKESRYMIQGVKGSGKSMLLVQAVASAIESGWIVLYEPEAHKWIDSSSQYAYDAESKTFFQTELAAALLTKLHAVNRDRLQSVTLPADVELSAKVKFSAGTKLDEVVALGAKDERVAVKALEATMDALSKQTEFPVLVAIDDAQCLFRRTSYRKPDYTLLESYHLSTPRLFLDYLNGKKEFARGAVLGALSLTNNYYMPNTELYLGLGMQTTKPVTPYTKLNEVHLENASSGIKPIAVPFGMSADEAAAMFEILARKGWATNGTDDVFLGAWQASQGNPGEMGRGLLQGHQAYIA